MGAGGTMDEADLETAAAFCRLVAAKDLLAYLGVPRGSSPDGCLAALVERRRHLQGMQANPKFKDSAKALIVGFGALQRVLSDPDAYVSRVDEAGERAKLPLLHLAIDAALADGTLTRDEEAFLRRSAVDIGFTPETYERVLRDRAAEKRVSIEFSPAAAAPAWVAPAVVPVTASTELAGAGAGYPWWDAAFTRMLLDVIPGGPGDVVDVYCRTGLSALTILPARRQLSWVGVDRSQERLESARAQVASLGGRVALVVGEPHALPVPDASVDVVIAIRALANAPDTRTILAEIRRVLRPGGRAIVAEPDGFSESFVFAGHLATYNRAFLDLQRAIDDTLRGHPLGRPSVALGPELFRRLTHAGLRPTSVAVHGSHSLRSRPFSVFSRQLRRYPEQLARAAGLPDDAPALEAVYAALDAILIRGDAEGLSGQTLPIYLAVALKD